MLYNITHMPQSIEIGYTGETQFRTIEIDLSAWMEIMPNGVPSIVHIRPGESESDAYITATEFENNILTWTVNNSDIGEHEGTGLAQVWLEETANETLEKRGMSLVLSTIVRQAVSGSDIETPAAQVPWLQQMTQLKTEAVTASIEAKNALSDTEAAAEEAEDAKTAAEAARDAAQAAAGDFQGISASAEGLDEGEDPTIEVTHSEGGLYHFDFGIPKGDKGDQGDPAPMETVQAAVDNYLSEVITNPDSPPLDRTLTSSSAATPADITGELNSAISDDERALEYTNTENYTFKSSDVIQGSFSSSSSAYGKWVSNENRIRVNGFIFVTPGTVLSFTPGTNVYGLLIGQFKNGAWVRDSSWYTASSKITLGSDVDTIVAVFKNSGGTAINPANYDATLSISTPVWNEINGSKSAVDGLYASYSSGDLYENGGIYSNGTTYSSTERLRSNDYIESSILKSYKCNTGYETYVAAYNATSSAFVGLWNGSTFTTAGGLFVTEFDFTKYSYKYKLVIKKSAGGTIIPADGVNVVYKTFTDKTLTEENKAADAKVVGEIKSDVYSIETLGEKVYELNFEQGEINTTTGEDSSSTIRIRSNAFVLDGYYDVVADGQEIGICYYNGATFDEWTGWLGEEAHIVPADGYTARLVVRKPNNETITPDENTVTVTKTSIIVKTVQGSAIAKNTNVFSVAHRGYAPNGQNHNKLEGYIAAAEHGFDYGETDLKETSDGVLVCCHDTTFVDATSGDTVTIATSTYAELLTHDYYGGKIAKFEDVLKACKLNGIGLFIDQLGTASIINKAFEIVKKYQMLEYVVWLFGIGADTAIGLLKGKYPKAVIGIVSATGTLEQYVNYANSIAENAEKVIIDAPYTLGNGEEFASAMQGTASNVYLALWTIDSVSTINSYLPYIVGYTSNLYSYNDLK